MIACGESGGDDCECECRGYSMQYRLLVTRPETEERSTAKAIEDEEGGWWGVVQAPVVAWDWIVGKG